MKSKNTADDFTVRNMCTDLHLNCPQIDYLNLPRCQAIQIELVEHIEVVRAKYLSAVVSQCPRCGCKDLEVDLPDTLIWDKPSGGLHPRLVQLFYTVFKCKACAAVVMPPVSELLYPGHDMTQRLVDYILHRMTSFDTFDRIALDTCQDSETIRRIFMAEFAAWENMRCKDLPVRLGIDEVKIGKNWLIVFVDLDFSGKGLVDVLLAEPERQKQQIKDRLLDAGNRDQIKIVAIDFSFPYRDAIKNILKDVLLVGDFFHLVKILQKCFDKVRLDIQRSFGEAKIQEDAEKIFKAFPLTIEGNLEAIARSRTAYKAQKKIIIFKKWDRRLLLKKVSKISGLDVLIIESILSDKPLLEKAYELRNAFLNIFEQPNNSLEDTSMLLVAWKNSIPDCLLEYFNRVADLIDGWHLEICGYAVTGVTNARTECKNGLIRLYDQIGRGYDFEALRARVLWADSHRRTHRWPSDYDTEMYMTARTFISQVGYRQHCEQVINAELDAREGSVAFVEDSSVPSPVPDELSEGTRPAKE